MAKKHYTVDNEKHIVKADFSKLTEKESVEIERFQKFGYTVVFEETVKHTVKRLDDEYIRKYLADKGEALVQEYQSKIEAPARDDKGKEKQTSTGKVRKQGFNAGRIWFAKNYPENAEEALDKIKSASMEKQFNKDYNAYNSSKKTDEDKMSKEEYTRYYYWTKVFVRQNEE